VGDAALREKDGEDLLKTPIISKNRPPHITYAEGDQLTGYHFKAIPGIKTVGGFYFAAKGPC